VAAKHGQPLKLTVTEFRLLQCLMESAGSVVATRALLRRVWGYDDPSGADLVRVTVYRLRRKIEDDPSNPVLVHTVPGVGVMLKPPA
jgi:DNA-binding response OmpR family regulator